MKGQNIIILGGSGGLGLATAKAATAEGAIVTIVSSNRQKIDEALKQLPSNSKGVAVDLKSEKDIAAFFETAGTFDHLVYSAGENLDLREIAATDLAEAEHFFRVRYWGALAAIKYGAPHINKGGSINLTGGTAGARPGKGWAIASSICGAVEGLVRAMAVELAPIRVNSVVPGVIKTAMWDSMPKDQRDGLYKWAEDTLLLGRPGEAEDVAAAFVYLMKQSFGTGQNIVVDGGTLLV